MKTFAMKLRDERKKRSMNQTEFAQLLGVSLRMIGDYESGKRRPHRNKMKDYAEILEVPYEYLSDDGYETVLSVFNGVKDNTPAEVKYGPLAEEMAEEAEAADETMEEKAKMTVIQKPKAAASAPVPQRAQSEMEFIKTHAHALFAGADIPQEAKDKFFEALYDSYLSCRSVAIESGMDVDRIESESMAEPSDDSEG